MFVIKSNVINTNPQTINSAIFNTNAKKCFLLRPVD